MLKLQYFVFSTALVSNQKISCFSQNDSTRDTVNDSSQSHFCNILEFLMYKPSSFAYKEMSIVCFSDDQEWSIFSVLPVWLGYAAI